MRFNKLDVPYQWKEQFTKYPHGYSIFEAISKWVKQVNDMITNINQWNEYLGGFTSTFGEVPPQMAELQREMEALLSSVNSDVTNIMGEVTGLADTLLSHLNNYATYLESELGQEHIIRSLPNGVKDEIVSGQFTNRVSGEIILSDVTPIWDDVITYDNYYLTYSDKWTTGKNAVLLQANSGIGRSTDGDYPVLNNIGQTQKGITLHKNTLLYLSVEKAKIDTQTGATLLGKLKAYLKQFPITLTYQLATPVEIPLPEPMSPNTREIVRLTEQVDKLTNAIIALGGTII